MSPRADPTPLASLKERGVVRGLAEAAEGVPCHLVGGTIRDALLGRRSRDLDAVAERHGRAIAVRLANRLSARLVELGGDRFAAYRLVLDELVIDLWDRQGAPLGADLERRDFTVNSMALDVVTGELSDPLGGLADLEARLLRATTRESFTLDPLRVLRLPRLLTQLEGFGADYPEQLRVIEMTHAGPAGARCEEDPASK